MANKNTMPKWTVTVSDSDGRIIYAEMFVTKSSAQLYIHFAKQYSSGCKYKLTRNADIL